MAKSPQSQSTYADQARRRGGGNYQDLYRAAKKHLKVLISEHNGTSTSYQRYLLAGICTSLECHLKYFVAHAAERFRSHPAIMEQLFGKLSVDVNTLLSITAETFSFADVVAASTAVSSMRAYTEQASHFFSVLTGVKDNFPWSYEEIFTENDPDWKKSISERLARLDKAFILRHRLIHEVTPFPMEGHIELDVREAADDALWLMGQFEKQYWDIEFNPDFGVRQNGMLDPQDVEAAEQRLDDAFDRLREDCVPRRVQALEDFREATKEFIFKRSAFEASVFVAQQSEETMSLMLDQYPEFERLLARVSLEQQFLRIKYPEARQIQELVSGGPSESE